MNPNMASANKKYNITTNGVTTFPGKLVLIALIVGTKGGTGHNTAIYDGTSADPENKITTIDTVNTLGRIEIGLPALNGIHIVHGGGTVADITVIYAETP